MAIKGSLKEASLADVCQLLALGQKTGCLSVTDRSRFGRIYFDRGRITDAAIINRRDRLGDLLVRDGVLNLGQVEEVLEVQARDPDRRFGEILLDRGWITTDEFEHYLRVQTEEAVYTLFTWSQGSFFFEVDQPPPEQGLRLSLNPESLLLEGARRVDEWSLIEKKIPTFDLIFRVDRDHLDRADVELSPEQEQLLSLMDGTRTVQELVDSTGLIEFDVGKALYGLIQAGFAHRVGQRRGGDPSRPTTAQLPEYRNLALAFYRTGLLAEAEREYRRILELQPDDRSAQLHLALIALRDGRDMEALRGFQRLIEEGGPSYTAFTNLGYILRRMGRPEDALLVLDQAESIRGGGEALLLRASIEFESGNLGAAASALESYRSSLADDEVPAAVYYHQSSLLAAVGGELELASSILEEGRSRHPASAPLLVLAGVIAERRGDFQEAERSCREAAAEDTSLPQAQKNLGDLAYRRGAYGEALDHYKRTIQISPELGDDVYTRLGNLYFREGERERALSYWEVALRLNPENRVVRNNLVVSGHDPGP